MPDRQGAERQGGKAEHPANGSARGAFQASAPGGLVYSQRRQVVPCHFPTGSEQWGECRAAVRKGPWPRALPGLAWPEIFIPSCAIMGKAGAHFIFPLTRKAFLVFYSAD
jgi:hypothetical protein